MLTKVRTKPSQCRICGEMALYKYFGIISCHACKIFFKRNAQMGLKSFRCHSNRNCQINQANRHVCTWCRLNKCFQSGMQIELIRCSRKSKSSKLCNSNWSMLNSRQIKSLLDLLKLFDNQTILSLIQNQINLPLKLRLKTSTIDPLFTKIFEHLTLFFQLNEHFLDLSSHDRLTLLRSVMTNTAHILIILFLNKIPMSIKNLFTKSSEHEQIIVKLTIINLVFANHYNRELFDNDRQIFELENFYIDLTWNYLLRKYNSTQTIISFLKYFRAILYLIQTIDQNPYHRDLVEQLLNKNKY